MSRRPMPSRSQELAMVIGDGSAAFEEPTEAEFERRRALHLGDRLAHTLPADAASDG